MKHLEFLSPVKRYVIDRRWFDLIETCLLSWGSQNVKSEFCLFWILAVEFDLIWNKTILNLNLKFEYLKSTF